MSILWLNAIALVGLAVVALPVAIHLLVRQQMRTVAYPSLRFLQETALASFRRRRIQDAALLACRAGVLAAAAIALAGPVLQTSGRAARQAERVSRAMVVLDAGVEVPVEERDQAFRFARIERTSARDAIQDAVRWLGEQPASSREIVIAGALRRGEIAEGDWAGVPPDVGLRFIAVPGADAASEVTHTVLARRDDELVLVEQRVRLDADATAVVDGIAMPMPADVIRIVAADADRPLAEAALQQALDAGVPWPRRDRRVIVVWQTEEREREPGTGDREPGAESRETGTDVVRVDAPASPAAAARVVWSALAASSGLTLIEPQPIPREQLDQWSRPSGPPSPDAPLADEGDRRWLWALALALLALEQVLRRDRRVEAPADRVEKEARVA